MERSCCGKRIERVDALEQGGGRRDGQFDDYIIQVEGPEVLEKALVGRVIRRCHRKGKNLWCAPTTAAVVFLARFCAVEDVQTNSTCPHCAIATG